jgi:hypothetical protein
MLLLLLHRSITCTYVSHIPLHNMHINQPPSSYLLCCNCRAACAVLFCSSRSHDVVLHHGAGFSNRQYAKPLAMQLQEMTPTGYTVRYCCTCFSIKLCSSTQQCTWWLHAEQCRLSSRAVA